MVRSIVLVEAACMFLAAQTQNKHTEKIYYLQYCLANSLSVFLARSYILNKPISINLCTTVRSWPASKVLVGSGRGICLM